MTNLVKKLPYPDEKAFQTSLDWQENRSSKKLLDVIFSVLAEEYIEITKNDTDIFTK